MKNVIIAFFLFVMMGSTTMAQGTLGKGGRQLNGGFGFSNFGIPVYVGMDFGVHESVTIGPRISYRNYAYNRASSKYRQSLTVLSFNGNYHFNELISLPKPWDFYAGLSLGYYFWSDVRTSSGVFISGEPSMLGIDLQVGGRYFFNNNFGVNLELGGGTSSGGSFGVTYKF